jgi:hypothetical protein
MPATKIATCCYCGTKAALVLRGRDRHELTCSNCGAPLRAMKNLPQTEARAATPVAKPPRRKYDNTHTDRHAPRPHARRKGKNFGRRALSGLWDLIEDVVDEVFD